DQLVDAGRDVDRAWLGQRLQARCGVQAIARDVIPIAEQLDETDSDAGLHARLSGKQGVAADQALADGNGAAHRLERAVEDRPNGLAEGVDEPAIMRCDGWNNDFTPMVLDALVSGLPVAGGRAGVV